jgi:hypothetical protein
MGDHSEQLLQVMSEVRDLLRLIAEPAIAQRDKKLRISLRSIAGTATGKKAKAVLLMDGTKNRAKIIEESGIDSSDLSALVKKLAAESLISGDPKQPRLTISIPPDFFERSEAVND